MPSFLDGFAQGFSSTVSSLGGIKADKRRNELERDRLSEQTRQFDITEERAREEWDIRRPAIEAETDVNRQRAIDLEFGNRPDQQELRTRATEANIDKVYGDIKLQEAQIPLINEQVKTAAYANTPEQRQAAAENLKATTEKLVADRKLTQAQADEINARIPFIPEAIQSEIRSRDASTRKQEQDNEIQAGGPLQQLRESWQTTYGLSGLEPAGPIPGFERDQAIPTERPPEPEDSSGEWLQPRGSAVTPGPQSAIPEDATIQQASLPAGGGGRVIQAQAGTRRLPLNDRTANMLEQAAAATGLNVRVTSGAQPSSGPNRTGSHRHDVDVGSGDIQLIDPSQNNKVLSHAVEADRAKIADFLRAAKANGATGFGAGPGYMNDTTIHVGFGSPAVWGAGGKGANAPDWLRQAVSGAPAGNAPAAQAPSGKGPKVLPTPRGGVANLNRQEIASSGVTAAKEGLKALYAGLTMPPAQSNGAIPVGQAGQQPNQGQQMRDILSGKGAASNQSMANAMQAIQETMPKNLTVSEAERNYLLLHHAYKYYTLVEPNAEKLQGVAKEILQSFRGKHNQYMAFAQQSAANGELDKAAKLVLKADGYLTDGTESKFEKDGNGNFILTTKNLITGKENKQTVTPGQFFAKLMQWSPLDTDRRVRAAAGAPPLAYEQGMEALAGPAPEVTYQNNVPQAIPTVAPTNRAEMSTEEATRYDAALGARNTEIENINKTLTPPEITSREDTNTELVKLTDGSVPVETVELLSNTFGQRLNGVFSSILQSNPTVIAESIADDLRETLSTAQAEQGLPFEVKNGDYLGMKKIRLGANEYNIPANQAMTIINTINRSLREGVEARFTGAYEDYKTKLARNIAGAQTEQALGRAIPDRGNNPNWRRDMSRGPIPTQ